MQELQTIIDNARKIVFFGGAGVSTESNIPDFRSVDGLYNQHYKWPPEQILSHTFFRRNTEEFYRFYREKMLPLEAQPNAAHLTLAALERAGKLRTIITQNIDGLHQAAGSVNVFLAGFCKAAWKLLYAANICDFQALNTLFLPLQSMGFLLAGVGIILMLAVPGDLLNLICVAVIVITTVYSGIEYFIQNKQVILNGDM